ncbi:MAG: alanine:cation symporter family protein [Myxococcota bacterium]
MSSPSESLSESLFSLVEQGFSNWVVAPLGRIIFFDLAFWDDASGNALEVPAVVAWLITGAVFFTFRFGFVNVTGFRHGIDCVRGRYSESDDEGEVSHFQALAAALSATVGLGNIAGVAFALGVGGPGATFWMILGGVFGMSSKFAECTLGQRYRQMDASGHVIGGVEALYLRDGLAELGLRPAGSCSVLFAIMCVGELRRRQHVPGESELRRSLQRSRRSPRARARSASDSRLCCSSGSSSSAASDGSARSPDPGPGYACSTACGFRDPRDPRQREVPRGPRRPAGVFTLASGLGGFVGTLMQGFRRAAAFSNEAGIGSAAIAHSAAKTEEPIREGYVALLEPFIDTVIVCTTTALVIIVTGALDLPDAGKGIKLTATAFATVLPWFPKVLTGIALLFAFSTMISWSYYGERAWVFLFGERSLLAYQLIFLAFTFGGVIFQNASLVLDFGDLMLLGMAFPNIAGVMLLSGMIRRDLDQYRARLAAGAFRRRD